MKQLYSIKSGAYKTSKDYARLKELLDAGHYVTSTTNAKNLVRVNIY